MYTVYLLYINNPTNHGELVTAQVWKSRVETKQGTTSCSASCGVSNWWAKAVATISSTAGRPPKFNIAFFCPWKMVVGSMEIILVLVIGGRDYIINPLEGNIYLNIRGMYCQLGNYMLPITFYKNQTNLLIGRLLPFWEDPISGSMSNFRVYVSDEALYLKSIFPKPHRTVLSGDKTTHGIIRLRILSIHKKHKLGSDLKISGSHPGNYNCQVPSFEGVFKALRVARKFGSLTSSIPWYAGCEPHIYRILCQIFIHISNT